ncbi:F-box protein At3g07870-like [Rhododendron vialii]|uniref:F-box protein At3g07870-like n=1 Tax=Rhododendron vialii TaxID=182163 RepID=UPI00266009F3|nr:F-box protein At3g07870-like [Rhododendron vialii]
MDQLPVHVLIDILSRLPIKPLTICSCVSKSFLNLTRDPRFTQAHLSRSPSSLSSPDFLLQGLCPDHYGKIYFLEQNRQALGDDDDHYTLTDLQFAIPGFNCFRDVGSCHGLLCLAANMLRNLIYVCNPFTREYVRLPTPRLAPACSTIPIQRGFERVFEWWCSSLVGSSPVNVILSFDVGDGVLRVIPFPDQFRREKGGFCSLKILSGCLSIVNCSSFGNPADIWVMLDYGVEESWTKCFTLKDSEVRSGIYQPLCFQLRDGKLLFSYNCHDLRLYDPQTGRMKMLKIRGLPCFFEAFTHVGSLVSRPGCGPN